MNATKAARQSRQRAYRYGSALRSCRLHHSTRQADSNHGAEAVSGKDQGLPGADGDFTLYNDDGKTYAYEKGDFHITDLHWDNAASKFTQKDRLPGRSRIVSSSRWLAASSRVRTKSE